MPVYLNDYMKIVYSLTKRAGRQVAVITEVDSDASEVIIPQGIDDAVVIELDKKALIGLGAKTVTIPDTVKTIGNWAFYGMKKLETVYIPAGCESFGKEIFEKSDRLKRVFYGDFDEVRASHLAIMISKMEEYSLLREYNEDMWYADYDKLATEYLDKNDETGFLPVLAGGEEDYVTNESDISRHCHLMRLKKVGICFERLKSSHKLNQKDKEKYQNYLLEHGIASKYCETWDYIKAECDNDFKLCDIFDEAGGFCEELIGDMLNDIGETNIELKAFLIGKKKLDASEDAFSVFSL